MKSRTFYQKLPLFIKNYPPFIKNYRWPPEKKLKPLISHFIKKTQLLEIIETPVRVNKLSIYIVPLIKEINPSETDVAV